MDTLKNIPSQPQEPPDALDIDWHGRAIGLLDLDAFFASVEQLDHPEWRGKPVIVGGDADRRGVVSTASYEARTYGVHSAMSSAQAERLCPNAIWTHGHYDRYAEISSQVMAIIGDETPLVEQVSIDEAFFDVTPGRFSKESPITICKRIQTRVGELGVTCSIGLGVCKSVAKIASERDKPRGLTVVLPGSEAQFLSPLPLRAMSGIGKATEAKLLKMHIHTLGELAQTEPDVLERALGVFGPVLRERAAGTERVAVAEQAAPESIKSVSNERTFAHDLTKPEEVYATLDAISAMVGRRLRKKGLKGSKVGVHIKDSWTSSRSAQTQLHDATDDEATFGPIAKELLEKLWTPGSPVRLLGVEISQFDADKPVQLNLFESKQEIERKATMRRLHLTTDEVKEKFGDTAVAFGRDLKLKESTTASGPRFKPEK